MSKTDFKELIKKEFIPQINRMISKEEAHLEYLKKVQKDFWNEHVDAMVERSSNMLIHLNTRLKEYLDYAEKN